MGATYPEWNSVFHYRHDIYTVFQTVLIHRHPYRLDVNRVGKASVSQFLHKGIDCGPLFSGLRSDFFDIPTILVLIYH